MADIFTPIMILVFYILGFHLPVLSRLERLYFGLLGCVAVAAHISHLTQALVLVSAIIIIHVFLRTPFRVVLTRSTILSIPLVLSAVAILLNNIVVHHSVALFPAGQSFLLANMIEQGPARRYLQETCPAAGYRICSVSDSMPGTAYEVLWAPDAAYQKLGGFSILVPAAYAINNTLSAFGSGVFDRYLARVTWLFALAGMLITIQLIESNPNKSMSRRVRPSGGATLRLKLARDLQAMQSATVNLFRRRSADRAELLGA